MSKGFTVTRCSVISLPSLTLALLLAANLSLVCLAQAQTPTHQFRDEFKDRTHIDIARSLNVTIDTTVMIDPDTGAITLTAKAFPRSTSANDSVALSGIDTTFKVPLKFSNFGAIEVEDIDLVPGDDGFYLVTDRPNKQVFIYDPATGAEKSLNLFDEIIRSVDRFADPVDAFPFLEGNELKVLITDFRGRIFKVKENATIEWRSPPDPNKSYATPSDAVYLQNSQEVLICETGKHQLIAINMATNDTTWQFDGGADKFSVPVDVEVDPRDSDNYLVTDKDNHRVLLVRRTGNTGQVTVLFGKGQPGSDNASLDSPTDADFVRDDVETERQGNILICDAGNNRLIEVTRQGSVVYTFKPLFGLKDADRLPNEQTLVAYQVEATKILPKRLGYESNTVSPEYILKPPFDFGQRVDFDSLRWTEKLDDGTSIRLQLRAADNIGDLLADDNNPSWLGPTGVNDFYVNNVTAINPALDGKQFIQFRVFLTTNSKLRTPVLRTVTIDAHFFPSTPSTGVITSTPITDSANNIITAWRSLEFTTASPAMGTAITVHVLDSLGTTVLAGPFPSTIQPRNIFHIDPELVPALKNKQALRLRATLQTANSAVTPILKSWALEWNFVELGPSQAAFTNSNFIPVKEYRLNGVVQDSAYIAVVDPNVLPLRDSVLVNIRSIKSNDTQNNVVLRINRLTRAVFFASLPMAFIPTSQPGSPGNRKLEVHNRDTLYVDYTDPLDTSDKSRGAALVIRRTLGNLVTENSIGAEIDTISINGSLFIRVTDEDDQNDSPTALDEIYVLVFNPQTQDSDSLELTETGDNTGDFHSSTPIRVVKEGTQIGNGRLSVVGGENITVRYRDPDVFDGPPEKSVRVLPDTSDRVGIQSAFEFIIAPNPYRANRNQQLNMRAQVRDGQMTVLQIEIYNLAGEKVRTIPGSQIRLGGSNTISSGQSRVTANGWWNLQGEDGAPVAGGTYFAKIYAQLTGQGQGRDEQVTMLSKLVIIH